MSQQQAGRNAPYLNIFPGPRFLDSAPTSATQAEVGQAAVVSSANAIYWCVNRVGSVYTWVAQSTGSATLTSLIVNPGDIDITAGDLNVTAGNINATAGTTTLNILSAGNSTVNGTLDVTGLATFTGDVVFNGDVDISSTAALSFTTTSNTAPAISFVTNGGTTETIVLTNTQGTNAAAIDLNALAGGITADAAGAISLDAAAASNFSVSGAGIDLTVASAAGRVVINGEEAAADAVRVLSAAGGLDANVALQMNLDSSQAAATAVRIIASNAAGGIDVDAGTGGIAIDSTGAFSIDGAAASNITTTGAGIDLTLSSVLGSVLVSSTEDAALAIRLHANGGTSETIQIHSDQGTGVGSVNLLSDVGGITIRSTGLASADAINLEAAAGGIDADAALQINIASSQAAVADSVRIVASAADGGIDIDAGTGGITIDTTGAFSIDGAAASNVTVTGAAADLTLSSAGGSVNITATEAAADAIVLNASNAAGGIDLLTGGGEITISSSGNVTLAPGTDTQASPTATAVVNARVFKATFTGFTTASSGTQDFTITNSTFGTGDGVFVTVSNGGTNDAKMTMLRVNRQTAGSIVVSTVNNGAAALNGNVVITGWVID